MNHQRNAAVAVAYDDWPDAPAVDGSSLAETNINPLTGLATDYLNPFNEAIMLLDMLSSAPEFRDDFLNWQPVGYREHFAKSRHKTRHPAIAAYEHADPSAREQLNILTSTMTLVLESTRAALRGNLSPALAGEIAGDAVARLKPMVARAGAVINGTAHIGDAEAPQTAVDDLLIES